MRKASRKLEYAKALTSFIILDQIIGEIDKICASPREKWADLLMNYRGRLYDLRSTYAIEKQILAEELNIE